MATADSLADYPQLLSGGGSDIDDDTEACLDFCDDSSAVVSSDQSYCGTSAPSTPLYVSVDRDTTIPPARRGIPDLELAPNLNTPILGPHALPSDRAVYLSQIVRVDCFVGDREASVQQRTETFEHGIFATIADVRRNLEGATHAMGRMEFMMVKDNRCQELNDNDFVPHNSTIYMRPERPELRMRMTMMRMELKYFSDSWLDVIVDWETTTGALIDLLLAKVMLTRETGSMFFFLPTGVPVLLRPSVYHIPARLWRNVPGGSQWHPAVNGPLVNPLTTNESRLFVNLASGFATVLHHQDIEYGTLLHQTMLCDRAHAQMAMDNNEYDHSGVLADHYHKPYRQEDPFAIKLPNA
jgi:hypothetical protein